MQCPIQEESATHVLHVQIEAQKADLDLQVVARNSSAAFNVTLPGTSVVCLEIDITKSSKATSPVVG